MYKRETCLIVAVFDGRYQAGFVCIYFVQYMNFPLLLKQSPMILILLLFHNSTNAISYTYGCWRAKIGLPGLKAKNLQNCSFSDAMTGQESAEALPPCIRAETILDLTTIWHP